MKKLFILLLLIPLTFSLSVKPSSAATLEECEKANIPQDIISDCIDVLSGKVNELGEQKKTLASEIAQFETQINLTEVKITEAEATIAQLEKEIGVLGFRIGYITESVDKLEVLLKQRIVATYQQSFVSNLEILLGSDGFSDLILRTQYLKAVQENDKKLLTNLLETKSNYANQKDEREVKQAAIEENRQKLLGLKTQLDQQKLAKDQLLQETKGSEATYQELLKKAIEEYQAIQGIVAGKGTEVEIGGISEGEKIATIIPSASCNSSGPHLHFIVKDGGSQNPFNYLKPVEYINQSGGDPFNPSGDWNWPIDPPIQFNQGYGADTWYIQNYHRYPFHDGIDISGPSYTVKAVKTGTLFKGSYSGDGGCTLPYMRVKHEDGKETFYLHVYSAF